ncbi:preprotein translocase subunit SecY [Candidatus Micrarchaeota archaeon]|nr:preprotein translocase subunit SecY [Candidatus Micrarchaeota archaeon]
MVSLTALKPIISMLPEVEVPVQKPNLKTRLKWTGFALIFFFVMGIITPVGIDKESQRSGFLKNIELITASQIGTLGTLGIGPIVMASIILQLLMGAGVIKVNLQDPEQKKLFQGTQKLGAIAFAFFEASIYVMSGYVPAIPGGINALLLVIQLAFAAIVLMYLDEVVSKYGIGSGVGLFIAAGVSLTIVWGAFSWVNQGGQFNGLVLQLIQGLGSGAIPSTALFPILFTVVVFLIVVFVESMKIEVPLTFGRIRGVGARYPLKFLYVSNIPVILAAALLANVSLWGVALENSGFPLLGHFSQGQPVDGLAFYLQTPYAYLGTPERAAVTLGSFNEVLNIIIFTAAMLGLCVLFGKFWVEMSNMGPRAVASQLQNIGLHVPGFRRDPRVIESVLERYIPVITILGSLAVGLLAVLADLTGALGTGTGILLTVGIVYRFYEELASQQAFESMPALREFMGG